MTQRTPSAGPAFAFPRRVVDPPPPQPPFVGPAAPSTGQALLMRRRRAAVQPIKADKAAKLGLVDALAPREQLLATAQRLALDIAAGRRPRVDSLTRTDK